MVSILETTLRKHRLLWALLIYLSKPPSIRHEEVLLEVILAKATIILFKVIWESCELPFIHLILKFIHNFLCFFASDLLTGRTLDTVVTKSPFCFPLAGRASVSIEVLLVTLLESRRGLLTRRLLEGRLLRRGLLYTALLLWFRYSLETLEQPLDESLKFFILHDAVRSWNGTGSRFNDLILREDELNHLLENRSSINGGSHCE